MFGRVVFALVVALGACKNKGASSDETSSSKPGAGTTGSSATGAGSAAGSTAPDKPAGEKRVNESGWSTQKGPGFTVSAPAEAGAVETVPANDDARALDRYTFHDAALEKLVVEITEIPADEDLGMAVQNMRMIITSRTQSVRSEDMFDSSETTGEVSGRDIWYVVDVGDHTLRARSRLFGKGQKVYEVRGYAPKGEETEAKVDKFVESFVFVP